MLSPGNGGQLEKDDLSAEPSPCVFINMSTVCGQAVGFSTCFNLFSFPNSLNWLENLTGASVQTNFLIFSGQLKVDISGASNTRVINHVRGESANPGISILPTLLFFHPLLSKPLPKNPIGSTLF